MGLSIGIPHAPRFSTARCPESYCASATEPCRRFDCKFPPKRVVLFNGPPRSGKDTAAASIPDATLVRFAGALKCATHAAFGLPIDLDTEAVKDVAQDVFGGMSPRQAYIAMSEQAVRPVFGLNHWGSVLAARVVRSSARLFVIPDSGFASENPPLLEAVGADNVLLIRVHRQGKTFEGDSRSYIELPGVKTVDLLNAWDVDYLQTMARYQVRIWLAARARKV